MSETENPFKVKDLEEIHLPNTPLVRVIAQVRFSSIVSIQKSEFIAPFQESLRSKYPVVQSDKNLLINIFDSQDQREEVMWRFLDESKTWRITLASEFLAFEALKYNSRDEFFIRYKQVVSSLDQHIKPSSINRIGIRYIDQITGSELEKISDLVRSEILDIHNSPLNKYILSSLRQTLFSIDEEKRLSTRWGRLEKQQTYDPNSMIPIDKDSWILDLDAFINKKQSFDEEDIVTQSKDLASYIYNFFRWAIKDEFLKVYGGTVND